MKRVLPYPLMTAALIVLWLTLTGSTSLGQILLGTIVALVASWTMTYLRPEDVRIKFSAAIPRLLLIVLADIVRSNIAVARIILSARSNQERKWGFISVPLDLQNRYGLAALAVIITATPGTLWMEHDAKRNVLLIHVLDLIDKQHWINLIKGRYERLLMEIFE